MSLLTPVVTRAAISAAQIAYRNARPFPHVVLDGWLSEHALQQLAAAFNRDPSQWHQYEDHKRGLMAMGDHPVVREFQSQAGTIFALVRTITGRHDLVSDPTLRGGGLHAVARGGRLGIHVDFNRHPTLPLRRAVNTLLYLNRDWDPAWQGALTLTDRADQADPPRPPTEITIQPIWNRWVIFEYSPTSWHGHPEPLECPPDVERRALAIYYYTPLDDPSLVFHTTQYADRPSTPR